MDSIVLHVYYTGEEELLRAFAREMRQSGLQQGVREEDGCGQYDYFFPADGSGTLLLLERWRDASALEAHLARPRMGEIRALKERFGLETRMERYE
ncbi:MAG: putative quinol monooxygenase [Oscillospiraceae bacterium]